MDSNYLQKELYELIQKDTSVFEFIQKNLFDGIWYWDLENPENEWMNERYWTTLGYNPLEMPHKVSSWKELIFEEDLAQVTDNFNAHLKDQKHPYDQIVRFRHKSGSIIWIRCFGKIIKYKNGKPYRMLGAHIDVTLQKQTEIELEKAKELAEENERRWKFALECSTDGVWDWDLKTNDVFYSKHWKAMLGFNEDELKNGYDTWEKLVHPDDIEKCKIGIETHLTKKSPLYTCTHRLQCKDKSYKWIMARGKVTTYDENGQPLRMVVTHTDLSETKKNESELLQTKQKAEEYEFQFRQLFENLEQGFALHKMIYDENGKAIDYEFILINKAFEKLTDISAEKCIGKTLLQVLPKSEPIWIENYGKVAETGKPLQFNNYANELNHYYDVIAYSPKKGYFATIFTDITEKKDIEKKIINTKQKAEEYEFQYHQLFENMEQGFALHKMIYDENGKAIDYEFIHINKAFEKLTDISAEKCIGKTLLQVLPKSEPIWIENYGKVAETGKPLQFNSFANELGHYYEVNAYSPKKGYFATIFTDITASKNYEKKIINAKERAEENELQFRQLFENMEQGFALHKMIYDENGKAIDYEFILINNAFEKLTDISAKKCIGKTLLQVLPKSEPIWIENYGKVAETGKPLQFNSFANELGHYYEVVAYSPKKGYFATIFTDITEIKNNEKKIISAKEKAQEYANEVASLNEEYQSVNEELKQTNEVLKETIENLETSEFNLIKAQKIAHLGSWYLNLETNKVQWTEELYKMYDFNPKFPPPPFKEHSKLFTPESWELLSSAIENTKKTGIPYELELQTIKKDDTNGWMWVSGEVVKNRENTITGMWGAAQDITRQKEIEIELKLAKEKAEENETHLKEIIDNLFEGYQILDFNWTYLYINKAAEKHNMRPSSEMLGKKYMDCWPGITKTKLFQLIKDCIENRNQYRFENEFIYPNGEIGWFDVGIQPVKDGVFILTNDISEKKRSEQKLLKEKIKVENSERQLKKAQRTAKVGNWIWYIQENRLWWSDEMHNIFEIEKSSFSGKLTEILEELVHPDDIAKVNESNQSVIDNAQPIPVEYRIKTRNGTEKYVFAVADEVIKDTDGKSQILTGIAQDITEYKLIQKQLEDAKADAEKSNNLKSSFLANMSHEIRTPMNAITGFASFLKDRSFSRDEIDKYADIIITSGNHLLNLINDIIDISKIDAGHISLSKEIINLDALMRELYSFFHSNLMAKNNQNITLNMNAPQLDMQIVTDETRLRQILINLLANAVKFTEQGEVEFGYFIKKDKLLFYVRDTGIGISPEKQEIIFNRFQQGTDSTEKLYGGTGLGLAIAKACTHLLNGNIWLESEVNKGTTFYFTIDYSVAYTSMPQNKQNNNETFNFNGEVILIAEDDIYNFTYLETVLSKYNLKLIRTKTGKETIDKALELDNIKLILMDIQMPDLTGTEATIEIRKHKPDLPIIAQTAYALNDDKRRFLEIGCNEYISKPINKSQLLHLVNNFLNYSRNN